MHLKVHSSTIQNSQDSYESKLNVCQQLNGSKEVVHIYNGILLGHKNEWNYAISAMRMQLEIIILSEVSQTNIIWYHWYVEFKMGFPGGSDGKESACNARDPGSPMYEIETESGT